MFFRHLVGTSGETELRSGRLPTGRHPLGIKERRPLADGLPMVNGLPAGEDFGLQIRSGFSGRVSFPAIGHFRREMSPAGGLLSVR
ncbi:MAG: hypothetical protein KatS3mg111_4212 [Pirellulaceae bacterium]|nr:MAG: hypothetical protein KatS3mg111_4212 [Pirellulaceae bacterium]